jgi:hypothetical protein
LENERADPSGQSGRHGGKPPLCSPLRGFAEIKSYGKDKMPG